MDCIKIFVRTDCLDTFFCVWRTMDGKCKTWFLCSIDKVGYTLVHFCELE